MKRMGHLKVYRAKALGSEYLRKTARIIGGFSLVVIGLILAIPFVPGPGIPLVLVGLAILSDHFHWARRIMDWVKGKWQDVRTAAGGIGKGQSR